MFDQDGYKLITRYEKLKLLESYKPKRNIFMFTGMPGSGKTTLAKQTAAELYHHSIYYQISDKDKDPISFCLSLYAEIQNAFPDFTFDEMEDNKPDIVKYEQYITELIRGLKKHINRQTVIVLDNTDILPPIGLGCNAVRTAMSLSSAKLHFIICSRRQCQDKALSLKKSKQIYFADSSFFKVTKPEFRKLVLSNFEDETSIQEMEKIYDISEGWFHSITEALSHYKQTDILPDKEETAEILDDYFTNIHSMDSDAKLSESLMLFSMMDEIPLELTVRISGSTKVANYLIYLLDNNLFIEKSRQNTYRLHTLFKSWLTTQAKENLSRSDIKAFLIKAAKRELDSGDIVKTINYLTMAESYSEMEKVISSDTGFCFYEGNQELQHIFASIPFNVVKSALWISMAYSLIFAKSKPLVSLSLLTAAYATARKNDDQKAKILAGAQLINLRSFYSKKQQPEFDYYSEVKAMLDDMPASLSQTQRSYVFSAVAYGGIMTNQSEKTKSLLDTAIHMTSRNSTDPQVQYIYTIYALLYESSYNISMFEKYTDMILENSEKISYSNADHMVLMQKIHSIFARKGDTTSTCISSSFIRSKYRRMLPDNPACLSALDIYDANIALHKGFHDEFSKIIEQTERYNISMLPGHLEAVTKAYLALDMALSFEEKAAEKIKDALDTADRCGLTSYHLSAYHLFTGAIYTLLGNFKDAQTALDKTIEMATASENYFVSSSAAAYLSYLYNSISNRASAQEYAVISIRYLHKTHQYRYLWSQPEITQNLFRYGILEPTTAEYTKEIANEYHNLSFNDKNELIPLMEIHTFGELTISLGESLITPDQISGNFRHMLAILLSDNSYSSHQEHLQAHLWPSSSKDHARKSFDNLMSRFRKLLKDSFYGIDPRDYVVISNGIVRLVNIKCSSDTFIENVESAKKQYNSGFYLSSIGKLMNIQDTYTERYFHVLTGVSCVDAKREQTESVFIDMLGLMYLINKKIPDLFDIDRYISKWLDIFIYESKMVRLAYRLYSDRSDKVKCLMLIKKYQQFLRSEGFTKDEIEELIYELKAGL